MTTAQQKEVEFKFFSFRFLVVMSFRTTLPGDVFKPVPKLQRMSVLIDRHFSLIGNAILSFVSFFHQFIFMNDVIH